MIHGMDTGFLVVIEMKEHPEHTAASDALARLITAGDVIAIAPQVLAEFIHIVTDSRRFSNPLDMSAACGPAEQWRTWKDVRHTLPNDAAVQQFHVWLQQFSLERKRLLDILLAATCHHAGVQSRSPPIKPISPCSVSSPV